MIEMRWTKMPEQSTKEAGFSVDGHIVVLQYRYRLPVHPGFIMKTDPVSGEQVDDHQWSDWLTVDLPDETTEVL